MPLRRGDRQMGHPQSVSRQGGGADRRLRRSQEPLAKERELHPEGLALLILQVRREIPPLGAKSWLDSVIVRKLKRPRGQGALKAIRRRTQHGPCLKRSERCLCQR